MAVLAEQGLGNALVTDHDFGGVIAEPGEEGEAFGVVDDPECVGAVAGHEPDGLGAVLAGGGRVVEGPRADLAEGDDRVIAVSGGQACESSGQTLGCFLPDLAGEATADVLGSLLHGAPGWGGWGGGGDGEQAYDHGAHDGGTGPTMCGMRRLILGFVLLGQAGVVRLAAHRLLPMGK